jgi:hypothetical protein
MCGDVDFSQPLFCLMKNRKLLLQWHDRYCSTQVDFKVKMAAVMSMSCSFQGVCCSKRGAVYSAAALMMGAFRHRTELLSVNVLCYPCSCMLREHITCSGATMKSLTGFTRTFANTHCCSASAHSPHICISVPKPLLEGCTKNDTAKKCLLPHIFSPEPTLECSHQKLAEQCSPYQ